MFSHERRSLNSLKEPTAGPSRYRGYVPVPVNPGVEQPHQQQQSHRDNGMVTINLEENGHPGGVSYTHQSSETFSGLLAARSFHSYEENQFVGNKYFPKLSSLMSTSCHAIQGKLSYARSSSVSCAMKSWWNSFQTSFSSIKESVLTMVRFPDLIMPFWTLRIRTEYTSPDGSLVTDTNEIQNFPSKEAAELYLEQWLKQIQTEGHEAEYIVDVFMQEADEDDGKSPDSTVKAMQRHGQQFEISQQEAEERV